MPSPNPSYPAGANLNAITAISPSDIWAVGSFYNASFTISAFALHYNGTAWSVTILPQPAVTGPSSPILHGVTTVASNNVWAVGNKGGTGGWVTLVAHWNGSAWTTVTSPNAANNNFLRGVSATSATDIWAVGSSINDPNNGVSVSHTLIEHWNGTVWRILPSPNVGAGNNALLAVAARSPSDARR